LVFLTLSKSESIVGLSFYEPEGRNYHQKISTRFYVRRLL
jgi:hypothetical protein